MAERPKRRWNFSAFAKLAVTAGVLAWLSSRVDWAGAIAGARQIPGEVFVAAIALNIAAFSIMGVRWWLLLRFIWPRLPLRSVFPSYYFGVFLNLVLPSGIGGDVARTLHLSWHGLHWPPLVSSMVADKAVGLSAVVLMGALAAMAGAASLPPALAQLAPWALLVLALGFALFMSPLPRRWLDTLTASRQSPLAKATAQVIGQCLDYRRSIGGVAAAIAISVASQSLVILAYVLLGDAVGLSLPPAKYFVLLPVLFLVTALPISIGGLGVREATLIALVTAVGGEPERAAPLALAYLLVLWISSAPGLLGAFRPRAAAPAGDSAR